MTREERKIRVVARGEHSDHCHVIIGGKFDEDGTITVDNDNDATIKHLIESAWLDRGEEIWTKEHGDLKLRRGIYRVVHQRQLHPATGRPVRVVD